MIDYSEYFKQIDDKFIKLINDRKSAISCHEGLVQSFFEENPYTLLSVLQGIDANYNFFGDTIISQPKLKGFHGDRQPDFLIVTANSLNLYFNFIEIEDPCKKIFHSAKQELSAEFSHAYGQLMQWRAMQDEVKTYCNELRNTLFSNNFNNTADKYIHYNYFLLYGFSDEVRSRGIRYNELLNQYFTHPDIHFCTFSRIANAINHHLRMFTVKQDYATDSFRAIGWVPFTKYDVDEWSDFSKIAGKEALVNQSSFLTNEQKQNLVKAIATIDVKNMKEIMQLNNSRLGLNVFDNLDI